LPHKFNVAAINRCTEAEGPFKRLTVWFQGCRKRCPGCCNPDMFEFKESHLMSLEELSAIIEDAKKQFGIEGVTCLGGEPVLQRSLPALCGAIRDIGLGVLLFTGFLYEELPRALIESVDMIVDGGFEEDNTDNERNLIGSKNQRMFFVTGRYKSSEDWFYAKRPKRVEINLAEDIVINGDYIV